VLDEAIRERGFAVIDMRDDRKITDVSKIAHDYSGSNGAALGQTQRPSSGFKKRAIVPQWGYNRHVVQSCRYARIGQ
jgi:hypothetical protein